MSDMMREDFFTVPIFYIDVENSKEINRKLTHDILEWKKEDEEGVIRSNCYGWHSYWDMDLKDKFTHMRDMFNGMQRIISSVEEYSLNTDLLVNCMWANVSPRYAYNGYHYHSDSLWSGVYYVQCPPNCGKIKFENRRFNRWIPTYEKEESQRKPHQWETISYKPVEGRAIFFPSCIGHEVEQNLTDVEGQDGYRISISFNSVQIEKEK